jgi:hypothetical protein
VLRNHCPPARDTFEFPTVQPDPLTVRALVYGYAAVCNLHQRRSTLGTVILGNGEHALAFLLGIPTFLLHQGLFTMRQLQSGEISPSCSSGFTDMIYPPTPAASCGCGMQQVRFHPQGRKP